MTISQEFKIVKFDDSIKNTFLNNYINFEGRSSRADYIWWNIFTIIINVVMSQIDPNYTLVTGLIFFCPGLGLTIRRLHDVNRSGWNYFWILTIIGIFPLIYWTIIKEGDKEDNIYGKNSLIFDET